MGRGEVDKQRETVAMKEKMNKLGVSGRKTKTEIGRWGIDGVEMNGTGGRGAVEKRRSGYY